ncbi:MAG: permease-like cell division protein FtsX [Bacteroidota bacterium]|nr:permease-like cell division protein FtsX [Bacteroidota bacterium]
MAGATTSRPRRSQAQLTTQFTTVIGMSLTLFLMGMLGLVALLGQWATTQMKQHVHVQVYLQRDMSQPQIDEARLAIAADPSVAAVEYLDPAEAAAELESELGESFVSFLGYVPLPPVVDLVMRPDQVSPEDIGAAAARFESIPGVADVSWHGDLLSSIQAGIEQLMPILTVAAILCLLVALALLNNTIRLTVFARRFLIRNMQLVGARPRLVRKPFVVQGLMLGATSGLFAFAGTLGLMTWFQAQLGTLTLSWVGLMVSVFVLTGSLLGAGFSSFAVNRYLKADLSQLH